MWFIRQAWSATQASPGTKYQAPDRVIHAPGTDPNARLRVLGPKRQALAMLHKEMKQYMIPMLAEIG